MPWYGSNSGIGTVLSGLGKGASEGVQSSIAYGNTKREAKEKKRRTLANLMDKAVKRNQELLKLGQDYGQEMTDHQNQALLNMARGFAESIGSSTRRGR